MMKQMLAAMLVLCLAASLAMAEPKTVVLKNGEKITGEVTKTPEGYRVETKMGTKTYRNDEVSTVETAQSLAEQYQEMLKRVDPKTADDHYTLAEWAYRNNMLDVAQKHLESALQLDAEHTKALGLRKQVEAKLAKTPAKSPAPDTGTPGPSATSKPARGEDIGVGIKPEYLVSEDDIYHIRIAEMRTRPLEKVNVKFRKDVIATFIKDRTGKDFKTAADIDKFKALTPWEQMSAIVNTPVMNPDELDVYKDNILVTSDPNFFLGFTKVVWPVVSASCAVAQCHGGGELNGGFKLFTGASHTAQIDYTNFIILDGFVTSRGRMISRGDPDQSLLLNFLISPDLAKAKHPKKIQTPFADSKDPRYVAIANWIRTLKSDHPAYRLKYQPPFGMRLVEKDMGDLGTTPTSAPAATPSAAPAPSEAPAPAPTEAPAAPAATTAG